eukprot:5412382-Pleurochrysis_carterae.AAC.1
MIRAVAGGEVAEHPRGAAACGWAPPPLWGSEVWGAVAAATQQKGTTEANAQPVGEGRGDDTAPRRPPEEADARRWRAALPDVAAEAEHGPRARRATPETIAAK